MDSEHRHELKKNELADWIAHFPKYVRENYMQVIGVILIIIGVFLWLFWAPIKGKFLSTGLQKHAQMTRSLEQVSADKVGLIRGGMESAPDSFLVTASKLELEANEADNPLTKAFLLIKRGEALRSDLHYREGIQDEAIVASQIQEALRTYQQAITEAGRRPGGATLIAMATFGTGLCAEEIGDFTKAEEVYRSIVSNPEFEGTVFPAQAQGRLDILDDNKGKVVFAKAPEVPAVEAVPVPELPETLPPMEIQAAEPTDQPAEAE
ncbi:MAG: tetratricopeptide repeat protein [Sedimentisphaerales bacterium]|nr:tetratricopeptide repeat protein [Sedimentisphaerales bacterium]